MVHFVRVGPSHPRTDHYASTHELVQNLLDHALRDAHLSSNRSQPGVGISHQRNEYVSVIRQESPVGFYVSKGHNLLCRKVPHMVLHELYFMYNSSRNEHPSGPSSVFVDLDSLSDHRSTR